MPTPRLVTSLARSLASLVALVMLVAAAGCSTDGTPTQPLGARPDASLVGDLLGGAVGTVGGTVGGVVGGVVPGLLACPSTMTYAAKKVVGPLGGVIRVGPHSLSIPPFALSQNVEISAVAPAGDIVRVDFQPHGLRFAKPTALTLSYQECGLVQGLLMHVVYVDDDRSILEVLSSVNNVFARSVTGKLDHFSAYAIATRSAAQ
jgi:hypothetical protein